tara:strand:- start:98 stop:307 length:210 start_codon:yes stop_codon:yes gene_type:complete
MFAKISSAEIRIRIADPQPGPDPEQQPEQKAQILHRIPDRYTWTVARPGARPRPGTRPISRKKTGDPRK